MSARSMARTDPGADRRSPAAIGGESAAARGRERTPRVLRGLGAGVLVASLSVFLFQGWENAGDLGRFALLLGQTGLLMAAGFASGRWLREPRGARIFVAIALVAVAANFAVLGGFLWAGFGLPADFHARAARTVSGPWLGGVTIASLLVLWPVCRIGFAVLARQSARWLTWLFLGSAAILLVPVRDAMPVSLLALAATGATIWASRRLLSRDPGLRSPEGVFALALALVPVGVVVARGIVFHVGTATPLAATGSAALYVVLREVTLQARDGRLLRFIEAANCGAAVLTGICATAMAFESGAVAPGLLLPIGGAIVGGLLSELSSRATRGTSAYRLAGATVLALATALNALLFDSIGLAALTLVVGIAVAVHAFVYRQGWLLLPAAVACLAGAGTLVSYAADRFDLSAWGALALIGVVAIVAGSVVERFGFAGWLSSWWSATRGE